MGLMRFYALTLSIILTATCLLSSPIAMAAANTCEAVFTPAPKAHLEVTSKWRKAPDSLFSAVRANAAHNWAYFKKIRPKLEYLKEAFEIEGTGVGDFHILNMGDIELANGDRKVGLIDVDDGGTTALLADFMRAAITNQVSPYKVPLRKLWNNYLDGLGNHKPGKPTVISKILNRSHDEFLDQQKNYIEGLTNKGNFSEAAEIRDISDADSVTQDVFHQSSAEFYPLLGDATILDMGYKIKTTGGSQGSPRFWYLIEKKGKRSIIEFKTLQEPATGFYQKQSPQKERIEKLIEIYRPQKTTYGLYQFLDAGKYKFIARERIKPFMDLDPANIVDKKGVEDGQQVYLYLAQRAGNWHYDQGQGQNLFKALTDNEEQSFLEFERIINNYIELIKNENK